MKTIKFIISAILIMMAFSAQAQTVQVIKDGKVVKEYAASDVDKVEVKQNIAYYSLKATSINEIESLTETDFYALTDATTNVNTIGNCHPIVLTEGTTAPKISTYKNGSSYYQASALERVGTSTITINGKTYNVWHYNREVKAMYETQIKIEIK